MMRVFISILLCICFGFSSQVAFSKTGSSINELDQLADEALQLTKFSRLEEAKALLVQFADLFSEQGIKDKRYSMDQLRVLTVSHHEAMGAVTSIKMNQEERIRIVTSFRLAADAIASTHQPMWAEMESPILNDLQEVKNAAMEGNRQAYNQSLNTFLSTYTTIQPSLKIDLSAERLQKLDSKITFLDKSRNHFSDEGWTSHLEDLEKDLKQLFSDHEKDEADPSLWWVITMTGSIIIATLSYVSWKKYKGQKETSKKRDSNN